MAQAELEALSKEALDVSKTEVLKEIDQSLRPTELEVKSAAQALIQYAASLQAKYGLTVSDQLATLDSANEASVLNFSKKYIKEKFEYTELMSKVFDFQNIVNNFLGQTVIMTFVAIAPSTGKVTLYNMENSVADLTIDKAAASRGGHIVGRMSSLRKIKNASKEIINSTYNQESLDNTFQEVWQRYRISKNKLKIGGAAYILWYINSWDGVWISGAGPLGEAYVAFFLNSYQFSNSIEPSVRDFMLNEQYGSVKADNASGFLKGDIVKGAGQFGVKVKGAQPLSYIDIITYAQEIIQSANITEYLKVLQQKLESEAAQNMVKPLSNILNTEYEALIDPLEKRLQQIGSTHTPNGILVAKF